MNTIDSTSGAISAITADAAPVLAAQLDVPDAEAAFRTKATQAAEKFESFFIGQMLKQMRAGTAQWAAEGSVFKDPVNQDMQGYADGLMADALSGRHAFGIADAILRQLLPVASATTASTSPVISPLISPATLNGEPPSVALDKR
jgi:flagellar protein FlgJ